MVGDERSMKVVFAASECVPFAKTGGLADVIGALPQALAQQGVDVSVFIPFYREAKGSDIVFEDVTPQLKKANIHDHVDVYLVDHEHYFDRAGLYGDENGDYEDNFDRFYYFQTQIFENLKQFGEPVDIIHGHDWHTGLLAWLLKEKYATDAVFQKTTTVLTIHNLAFQGIFPKMYCDQLGIQPTDEILFYDQLSFLKLGIVFSDQVTTVSQQYAKEIQSSQYGCGLEKELSSRTNTVKGIINGLDYDVWNPATDPLISENYDMDSVQEQKPLNKAHLQNQFGLTEDPGQIIFGFVGRIAEQKGVEAILEAAKQFQDLPVQMIIQGVGDPRLEEVLKEYSQAHAGQCIYFQGFDESIAHRIYAGSDFFLMPSTFEPCGLSQMIAMHYGTLPIVAPKGGLVDTVKDEKTGLMMADTSAQALIQAMQRAKMIFEDSKDFTRMQKNAMHARFDWGVSAQDYKDLYQCTLSV